MAEVKKAFIILTPGFAASEDDSTCLPMQQQLVKEIIRCYPELKVFVLSFQYPYHSKEYCWNLATVIPFDGRNRGGVYRLLIRRKAEIALRKITEQCQVVGMLSFWLGECAVVGKRFGERHGIRHYCWISGQDARKNNIYARRVSAKKDELIALSDFLQEEFEKNHGTRPSYVIPPGISSFEQPGEQRDIDILGVGSLIPLKQYPVFIEVLAEVKKTNPRFRSVLVGEGPERDHLDLLASQYGLQENLKLTGKLPYSEVMDLMCRSKLLLHPSSYEGFSGVCMEALSRGAHVVSFCRAMNREIDHWHIVDSAEKMKIVVTGLLQKEPGYAPVIISDIKETVSAILQLYPSFTG